MVRQIVIVGAATLVFAVAVVLNLWVLDAITVSALKQSLGRISSVILVSSAAVALIVGLARLAGGRSQRGSADDAASAEPRGEAGP